MKKIIYLLMALAIVAGGAGCSHSADSSVYTIPIGGSGTLNLYGIDPITLDPALSGDSTSNGYIYQVFSGLVKLDANLEPVPDIAQSWEISPDGKTYTFYLRQDVLFHDGRNVTSEDVKYSWERACLPETASPTAATYLGDIAGVSDMLAGTSRSISGVEILDKYVLKVTLTGPKSYFLSKLSYVTSFIVDKKNVASGSTWWRKPVGTGPFLFSLWNQGDRIVLERNPLYYGDKALLYSVVYNLWAGVPMNMYELGQLDVAEVDLAYYDRIIDESGPFHDELVITPELALTYIGFDCTRPPFDDPNIRKAFIMAVNKDRIIGLVSRNTQNAAYGILPEGMPGYNEWLIGLSYDVEHARELIAASKYGSAANLPRITITTSGYGGYISQELEAIINEWRVNLGVEVEVRELDPEEFFYNLLTEKDSMFYWGWNADYAHPQNFLETLFASGSQYNVGEYNNEEFNALLRQAGAEQDIAKSLELYQQAEELLVQDAACMPLWGSKSYTLVKPYVKGYEPNALGLVMLNKVYLETQD
jgi:oligopeptide transport system substrate-binding protein